ncbi:MAG: phosphate acetyltransferase [Verrucomicrobia bacterium]|nr:phosphate acetyltransferase [Verrucomicrobiota bacterium]
MRFIGSVIEKLQRHPKRVVFPEGAEPRIIQAARQYYSLRLGAPILLGNRTAIKDCANRLHVPLDGVRILDPKDSDEIQLFEKVLYDIRKSKGMTRGEAAKKILNPAYFGAMMAATNRADSIVSGASEEAESLLRALFQVVNLVPHRKTASSCMILELENASFGDNGVLFMADCGVIPDPTDIQLAHIAVSTAELALNLLGKSPRVAMLAFSTLSQSSSPTIQKVKKATQLARELASEMGLDADFDGELQLDSAIVPSIAETKAPESPVAGKANVLIFPDLNSGNIASKLVQHIGRSNAYGQIILGLNRAAADVSRGSSSHDILGVAAVTGLLSNQLTSLYPEALKLSTSNLNDE